jgi:hypothetical protein
MLISFAMRVSVLIKMRNPMDDHEYLNDCLDDLTQAIELLNRYKVTGQVVYLDQALKILIARRMVVILLIQT